MRIPMLSTKNGEQSISLTMTVISFIVVIAWLILYIVAPMFGITNIPAFNGADAMLLLTPIMTLYFGRRNTEAKTQQSPGETP